MGSIPSCQDKEPKGIIPLENIQIRDVLDRSKANCFELFSANSDVIKACKTDSEGKVIEGLHHFSDFCCKALKFVNNFGEKSIYNFDFVILIFCSKAGSRRRSDEVIAN